MHPFPTTQTNKPSATDYNYARLPTSFLHDPRLIRMPAAARWIFISLYLYATEKRLRTLPPHLADTASVAAVARCDQRTVSKALQSCTETGLLSKTPEGGITVSDIESYAHGNARWRDVSPGRNPPEFLGKSHIVLEKGIKKETDTKIIPPPTPSVAGALGSAAPSANCTMPTASTPATVPITTGLLKTPLPPMNEEDFQKTKAAALAGYAKMRAAAAAGAQTSPDPAPAPTPQ